MQLKIKEYQLPGIIEFNYQDLKKELEEKVSIYTNLVYTDDQVVQAKADRASLNKLKKALNDERIRREKEYMQPFNEFKQKINEIISIIDKPCEIIDQQVKSFEEQKKQDKMDAIIDLWNSCDVPEGLTMKRIFDQKWLNASTSMKSIQDAIAASIKKFNEDIQVITELPEFSFEAKQTYISTLDLGNAIQEAHRLSEVAKKKAEYEAEQAKRAEEEKIVCPPMTDKEATDWINDVNKVKEDLPDPDKQWIRFQALLSTDEAALLKTFFMTHDIEFKPL